MTDSFRKRKQAIYENRAKKRRLKKQQLLEQHSFDQMYNFKNWITALEKSKVGTYWKGSVQWYSFHPIQNTYDAILKLQEGKYPYAVNKKRLQIRERGKIRNIEPIKIEKRHGEHVFCDNIYAPLLFPTLIHDNGASRVDMGVDFTRNRFTMFLNATVNKYGNDFYIWRFDFKSYFESIKYKVCEKLLRELLPDERAVMFAMESITEYSKGNILLEKDKEKRKLLEQKMKSGNGNGVCLGSQISQITALMLPNVIDHYIKDKCGIKCYNRFMDDGIVLHPSKNVLMNLYEECKKIANELGLEFNATKTCIMKATKMFKFLKIKYNVVEGKNNSYHVLKRIGRKSVVRMRRKLKRFKHLLKEDRITLDEIFDSFRAWYNNSRKIARTYKSRKSMLRVYIRLFGEYKLYLIKNKYAKNLKERVA